MARIYIKLQTPSIELAVEAVDAAGTKDSIKVGFKRYDLTDAQAKLDKLQELLSDAQEAGSLSSQTLDTFIKDEIIYIKQAKLELEEDGKSKDLLIADTRTTKPVADLWDDSESALDLLTSMYLSSAPYRLALILASQKALLNSDYSGAEVKN
jgi:hypothetical protein